MVYWKSIISCLTGSFTPCIVDRPTSQLTGEEGIEKVQWTPTVNFSFLFIIIIKKRKVAGFYETQLHFKQTNFLPPTFLMKKDNTQRIV